MGRAPIRWLVACSQRGGLAVAMVVATHRIHAGILTASLAEVAQWESNPIRMRRALDALQAAGLLRYRIEGDAITIRPNFLAAPRGA